MSALAEAGEVPFQGDRAQRLGPDVPQRAAPGRDPREARGDRGGNAGRIKALANALVAFLLWYFWKGGRRDGAPGLTMSRYAFRYTRLKYRKARLSKKGRGGGR